jgi:hypothetical protein
MYMGLLKPLVANGCSSKTSVCCILYFPQFSDGVNHFVEYNLEVYIVKDLEQPSSLALALFLQLVANILLQVFRVYEDGSSSM